MATYYIKPSASGGNDSNNGLSPSTAWATVGKALELSSPVSSGDIVYIAPGVYRQTANITLSKSLSSTLTITGDTTGAVFGVASGEVRMTTYPSESAASTQTALLNITASNVTINNLTFELGGNMDAFVVNSRGRNHTFYKCVFIHGLPSNNGGSGGLFGTSQDATTTNRVIDSCIFTGNRGITVQVTSGGFSGTTVKNCLFINATYSFYQTTGASQSGTDTSLITNCTFLSSTPGACIRTDDGSASGLIIQNNLFIAMSSSGYCLQTGGASQNTFIIEDYNRIIGFSVARANVASVGANTTTTGTQGVDYGSVLQGYAMVPFASARSTSSNISYGRTLNAPTTDIYGNPWTGVNPDAGASTYKIISNPQYIASDSVVNIRQNTTSRTEFINLNSVGYKFNTATLVASYIKLGGTRTNIPLVTQTITGAWTSGGFVEIDPINMPGLYRFDVPDTVFASSASAIQIINTANSDKATITYKFTQEYKIDLTQAVPEINVPNTVGDALNAARAGTFGGMTIGNKELNYYSPTNAIIKTFTVDSNTYIRSKKEKNFIPYDGLKLYLDAGKGLSYSGTGSNWVDLSGNYNNGFLTNGPTYNSSNEGTIVFDGTNDYISFNTQPLSSTAFTIILNFKISTFTNQGTKYRRLIAINQTGYAFDNPFAFFVNDTGKLGYLVGNGASNTEEMLTITGGPTLELNKWYHAALTFNGTQKKLYIGGNLISTISNSTTFTNSLNNKLIIGSRNGTDGCLQGSISTVHVYNRALSDTEVMSNYAIYNSRYVSGIVQSGLLLYIDPNNLQSYPGSGIVLYNLVNTQYNGVMTNGASFGSDSSGGYIATDGTNDYVKFPLTRNTTPYTVFVFSRIFSSGRMISDDSNWLMGQWQGQQNAYHANAWVWQNGGPSGNGWRSHCVTGDYTNDNWKVFANGVKLTENSGGSSGFTNITWGIWNSANEPCAAHFGVFLVYDRVLTDAEVLQNHEALRGRYGI